jgi:hypothetical protein
MRKLIDIKQGDLIPLKVLAAKQNKNLKNYIEDLLTDKVKRANKSSKK